MFLSVEIKFFSSSETREKAENEENFPEGKFCVESGIGREVEKDIVEDGKSGEGRGRGRGSDCDTGADNENGKSTGQETILGGELDDIERGRE